MTEKQYDACLLDVDGAARPAPLIWLRSSGAQQQVSCRRRSSSSFPSTSSCTIT